MIKTEMMKYNTLIRHFSDEGKMIRQVETGVIYSEAVDVVTCEFTYEEIDQIIEEIKIEEEEDKR